MNQCQLCQNYQKPENPDTVDSTCNPCYESRGWMLGEKLNHGGKEVSLTCQHFSFITGGKITMRPRH